MKKKIVATTLTACIATALVATNGVVTTFAFTGKDVQEVKVIGQQVQTEKENTSTNDTNVKKEKVIGHHKGKPIIIRSTLNTLGLVKITEFPDSSFKTSEDMNNVEAVKIAKKAVEEKFQVSLNGSSAYTIFCDLEKKEGQWYLVSFDESRYMAFVNSKTGELFKIEKNPTAPEGAK